MTAFTRWTARHDRAVAALLSSTSIRQAADRAGVGERTLRRWLREPLFADRLAVAQREAQQEAFGGGPRAGRRRGSGAPAGPGLRAARRGAASCRRGSGDGPPAA
jgi:hypothetical protein